jgi:molecular chaperone GrpE
MTPSTPKSGDSRGSGRARPGGGRAPEGAPNRGAPAVPGAPGWSAGSGWARGTGGQDGPGRPGSRGHESRPEGAPPEPDTAWGEDVAEGEIVDEQEAVEHDLDQLLVATRRERDEYLDMLRRVQADFENYKKRMLRQQTDHLERAAESVVMNVLPALDAFDLARAHLGEGDNISDEGKALIQASSLLRDTLAKEGLERIDEVGVPFDPTMHDAVDHVKRDAAGAAHGRAASGGPEGATDGGDPNGGDSNGGDAVVDAVLRSGYRWKGRVIRPAMVRVRG